MNNFDYTITTKKSFDEAVRSVSEETKKAGFRVLYIHDVAATLAEKNFQIDPLKIIEICNAKSAYAVLQADIKIGLCLPCKINVYVKNKQTFISGMRPIILSQFFPDANLGNLPKEVDKIIQNIINKAK
ncbi:hypothetical protein B6D29_03315 [Microgenomates bacterium UTCPR1]|nr:MAG: hypothetical protein B6D29_03315 [Microgenomates bacterium UTCPR1]